MSETVQRRHSEYTDRQKITIRNLAITEIVLGILAIALGIAVCAANRSKEYYSLNGYVGTGIWFGVFTIATGAVSIRAAIKNSYMKIVTATTLNSVSILFSGALLATSVYSAIETNKICSLKTLHDRRISSKEKYGSYDFGFDSNDEEESSAQECNRRNGLIAADSLLVVVSVVQLIIAFTCMLICSEAIHGKQHRTQPVERVDYRKYSRREGKAVKGMGIAEIVLGLASIVFGIVVCVVNHNIRTRDYSLNGYVGTGVWAGVVLVSVGSFSVSAVRSGKKSQILVCIFMNAIGAMFACALLGLSIVSAFFTNGHCPLSHYDLRVRKNTGYPYNYYSTSEQASHCPSKNALLAADVLLSLIATAQIMMTIACAMLSIKAFRKKRGETQNQGGNEPSAPQSAESYTPPASNSQTLPHIARVANTAGAQSHSTLPTVSPAIPPHLGGFRQSPSSPSNLAAATYSMQNERPPSYESLNL